MTKRLVAPMAMQARINVTPIIDVALVLVIILMITAPMLSVTDATLDLPSSRSQAGAPDTRIFLTLARDGGLGVDDVVVPPGQLANMLATKLSDHANENPVVVIRADRTVQHARVRELLEVVRAAGASRVAVATRPGDLP